MSARDFSMLIREKIPLDASTAFDRITEEYLAERFGIATDDTPISPEDIDLLKSTVNRMGLRNQANVG